MENDVAVIGIGCRLPGADNIEEFWRVLVNGENHVTDIPQDRWNNDAFFSENKNEKGKHSVRKAALLQRHDEWDNKFFGISDYEAAQIDPQQRYVLECTHMAFEDGGITNQELKGSNTGVYIGCMSADYRGLFDLDHDDDNSYTITGTNDSIISARVSYVYDLSGPSMVVNTACSSSMTAIHLGCLAIKSGDCEMAVCGGVGSILNPNVFIPASKAGMMSTVGQCQAFCETADGYVRGEGCGIIVLKSYAKAIRDKNRIWGIIRTGVNQDGHASQPITAPSGKRQEELLHKLYEKYSMDPQTLQYIECHGTGTPVGDPVEVNALGLFIQSHRGGVSSTSHHNSHLERKQQANYIAKTISGCTEVSPKILIGSVKTNIGHLEAGAGVAGLIKILLMMRHGMFVPSLHAKKDRSNWNRNITFDKFGLDISVEVSPWGQNIQGERIGCVNSFGFGGSNAHCIVVQKNFLQDVSKEKVQACLYVICVTASNRSSLLNSLQTLDEDLERTNDTLQDISFTSVFRRNHYKCRVLLFGESKKEIQSQISKHKTVLGNPETVQNRNIVFIFSGMGTAWQGMCQELMNSQKVFSSSVKDLDDILAEHTGFRMEEKFRSNTVYKDPFLDAVAIFYVQIGLYHLWKSWGILPDVVVGQSVGEVAAAYASGALTLEDAARVIYIRSKYLSRQTGGKMIVVGNISRDALEELCRKHEQKVTIAVYNSPTSYTLSGDATIMEMIETDLLEISRKNNGHLQIRHLSVDCAYHSHHVNPCLDDIRSELNELRGRPMICRHISTVSGEEVNANIFVDSNYWTANVRQPVKFMQAIKNSTVEESTNIFLEVGPKPVLRTHMETLFTDERKYICISSLREKYENQTLYSSLGKCFEFGVDIFWSSIVPPTGCVVPIPHYVFSKSKNLFVPHEHKLRLKGVHIATSLHMFLRASDTTGEEFSISVKKEITPFVFDHFFFDLCLVPGVTFAEAAFEIGVQKLNLNPFQMDISVEFLKTMTVDGEKNQTVSLKVDTASQILEFSAKLDEKKLCFGHILARERSGVQHIVIQEIMDRCTTHLDKQNCYDALEKYHFTYGQSLKVIEESWSSEKECLVRISLPESVLKDLKRTHFHPSAMDAVLQSVATMTLTDEDYSFPYLPKKIGSVVLNRPIQQSMLAYSHTIKVDEEGKHYNCLLLCPNGFVIAEIHNFYYQKMDPDLQSPKHVTYYNVQWSLTRFNDRSEPLNQTDQVVFLCSRRFADMLLTRKEDKGRVHVLSDIATENKTLLRQWLNQTSISALVYAPCPIMQETLDRGRNIMDQTMVSFLTLQFLLQFVEEQHMPITVYVLTESVWSPTSEKRNVLGSELWGMVRSAILELPQTNLRLVDMVLCDENMQILQHILLSNDIEETELLINEGKLFHCEVAEYNIEENIKSTRDIQYDLKDIVVLNSSTPSQLLFPHFRLCKKGEKTPISTECQLKLKEVYLHDPALFPISSVFLDTEDVIWPEDCDEGFKIMCLEGCGFKINTSDESQRESLIGFCFPIEVTSVIAVPSDCTFMTCEIPCYQPGMMTIGIIIWDIIQHADVSKYTSIVVNDDSNIWIQLAKHMVLKHDVVKKQDLCHCDNVEEKTENVILLSTVSHKHIEQIVVRYPHIKRIVTTDIFMANSVKVWLEQHVNGIQVIILSIGQILDSNMLKVNCKVGKVVEILRTFNAYTTGMFRNEGSDAKSELFDLPFRVLPLCAQTHMTNRIPLKVDSSSLFRKNGCYIVVGGLSGLGWELLQYLTELGAGYVATFSRQKVTKEKKEHIARIQTKQQCRIIPIQVDITVLENLQTALKILQRKIEPATIRGVIHGGGILCDKFLKNMSEEDVKQPLLPKILGTWNLHSATLDLQLDYFIMHSSIASVFGSHGQSNYAAGNSFQDAFAHFRRQQGLCGQSINWSILSVGMAARDIRLADYWKNQGFIVMTKEDIRKSFLKLVMGNYEQMVCGKFDWIKLSERPMFALQGRKYRSIIEKYSGSVKRTNIVDNKFCLDRYTDLDEKAQYQMVLELAKSLVSEAIIADIDTLHEDTTLVSVGIDSMSAMSLVNRFFDTVQIRIALEHLLSASSTIRTLTNCLIHNIEIHRINHSSLKKQGENKLNLLFKHMLSDDITFMQRHILQRLANGENEAHHMYQVEFEILGAEISLETYRSAVRVVCSRHQELRRVYLKNDDETYKSEVLNEDKVCVEVKEIDCDIIDSGIDMRETIHFDLAKDAPIKLHVACKDGNTLALVYLHSLAFDMASIEPFFQDLGAIFQHRISDESFDNPKTSEAFVNVVHHAIFPQMKDMLEYWIHQMSQDVHPFTFGQSLNDTIVENKQQKLSISISSETLANISAFSEKRGVSLYEYVVSAYFAILHEKTKLEIILLLASTSLRNTIPQLKGYIARGVNYIPLIANFKNIGTTNAFLLSCSEMYRDARQHNLCPFELILEAARSEEMKTHIGRHVISIDNMTHLNKELLKSKQPVKIRKIFHGGYYSETCLNIEYDTHQRNLNLTLQYESQTVSKKDATEIMEGLCDMMLAFVEYEDTNLHEVLKNRKKIENLKESVVNDHQTTHVKSQDIQGGNYTVIRSDTFYESLNHGHGETVLVQIVMEKTRTGNVDVMVIWRRGDGALMREINIDLVSAVDANEDSGNHCVMLRTVQRQYTFQTPSKDISVDWIETLKAAADTIKTPYRLGPKFQI